MKNIKQFLFLFSFIFIAACSSDDDNGPEITVGTGDFNFAITDDKNVGDIVGQVTATTSSGVVTFTIASQSVAAFNINPTTGDLAVANANLIDANINPVINVVVNAMNGEVVAQSNVTVTLTSAIVDEDGDGVLSDVDENDNDPCTPAQNIGYTGYDSSNAFWASADCDSDGTKNGEEVTNNTDPYDETSGAACDSTVDTSVWSDISLRMTFATAFFTQNFTKQASSGDVVVGCGIISIRKPFMLPACTDTSLERNLTLALTPDSEGATTGTIALSNYDACDQAEEDGFTVVSGTYDETTKEIVVNFSIKDGAGPGFDLNGTYTVVPF
ncbi:cadherin repeat domain-containing protein [Flavivirga abyssicola]|uniref:cadherin repeat domain-containing protein n=1 Tax=Flavivirga abyssicola TaxID=3063533 RepID=UPI0026DF7243|nr:cadherin repeat domain-containing protein [Flavivirga sp. MEBiC07777]WVK12018.1 cadherin repeat domain-containing protein [Flavivirga sp. MEBiC07777]